MVKILVGVEKLKEQIAITVTDPRRTSHGNIRHKLEDMIVIALCTIICKGEDFEDMEAFGLEWEEWLRTFLELPNGIPDADTFRRLFERLDPKELSKCLADWLDIERSSRSVVAIDGKTIRGSGNGQHKAYHVVSAFVSESHLTLGDVTVPEKTNEITAIPELLDLVDVKGDIVTIDAMGCQKAIAEKIISRKADYAIALKDNQPALCEDVRAWFEQFSSEIEPVSTFDKDHGRIERREYRLLSNISWLEGRGEWKGLKAVGEVKSTVEEKGAVREYKRYFITSLTDPKEFANAVRSHWGIENSLHWTLDVIFREDASCARKDNSPLNLNVLRKQANFLLKQCQGMSAYEKQSKKRIRFRATMNPKVLCDVLFGRSE